MVRTYKHKEEWRERVEFIKYHIINRSTHTTHTEIFNDTLSTHFQEHCDGSLTLNFLDEVAGLEEAWNLEFVSSGAAEAVINSIQPPWEALFSIPLQVSTRAARHTAEKA